MDERLNSRLDEKEKKMTRPSTEYSTLQKEIENKCMLVKKEWFNEEFAKIERISITLKADMHKIIQPTVQKTFLLTFLKASR